MFAKSIRSFSNLKHKLDLSKVQTHLLSNKDLNIPTEIQVNKDEAVEYYRTMSLWRRAETMADNLYKEREIRGFCHLYNGQESIVKAIECGLSEEDAYTGAYRIHCHALIRGCTVEQMIGELMGRVNGLHNGIGGSMHFYNPDKNYYGGNGIVGAQVPMATGIALAYKLRGETNRISIGCFGDGAANQGQIVESINMAQIWKLPVMFMLENNNYAMGTSSERHSGTGSDFYNRLTHLHGVKVDCSDVFLARETLRAAKAWMCKHQMPIYMEMKTYRYYGHSMSDPGLSYRSRDEVAEYRNESDCIGRLKGLILDNKMATEKDLKDIDKAVRKEVDEAVQKSRDSPRPDGDMLYNHILNDNKCGFVRRTTLEEGKYFPNY